MHQRQNSFAKISGMAGIAFLAAAFVTDYWPSGSPLTWMNLNDAVQKARESNKPVFVDMYADWCTPCKQMDRLVFPEDSVKNVLQQRYILAKVNIDHPVWGDSVKKQFRLRAVPTYIVLTPGGREVKRHVGFFEKSAFILWLQDSSRLLIFSWLTFDKAYAAAATQGRRLLVLVTGSSENFEPLSNLFDIPEARKIIDSLFVPTILVRTNAADNERIARLGGGQSSLNEIIALDGEKELGRFFITQDMFYNQQRFLERFYGLVSQLPGKSYPPIASPKSRARTISMWKNE